MNIRISARDVRVLKDLAANYFVVRGEKPMPLGLVVHRIIEKVEREAHPREYQTTGFDRQ